MSAASVPPMHLLWALLIGLIVGALAKLFVPGNDPQGLLATCGLGVIGSVVASLLGQFVGWYRPGEAAGFLASVVGAIIVLAVYRRLSRPSVFE